MVQYEPASRMIKSQQDDVIFLLTLNRSNEGEPMNPIPMRQTQTAQTSHMPRNVMCRHYNRCLDRAVEMDWKGFACSDCRDYELEAVGDYPHWQEQEWRAAYLLLKIAADGR